MDSYLAVIQTAAVLVGLGGLLVALAIATADRRRADERAETDRDSADARAVADREAGRQQAEHRWTLDLLVALSRNLADPDSTDSEESRRKGGERAALIQAIGAERLPVCWQTFRQPPEIEGDETPEETAARVAGDPAVWAVGRCEAEVFLLLQQVRRSV